MIEFTEGRADRAATVDDNQGIAVAVGEGPTVTFDAGDPIILTHENGLGSKKGRSAVSGPFTAKR